METLSNNRRAKSLTSKRKAMIAEIALSGMVHRILCSEEKKRKEDDMETIMLTHHEAA